MATANEDEDALAQPSQQSDDVKSFLVKAIMYQIDTWQLDTMGNIGNFAKGKELRKRMLQAAGAPLDDDAFDEALRQIYGDVIVSCIVFLVRAPR